MKISAKNNLHINSSQFSQGDIFVVPVFKSNIKGAKGGMLPGADETSLKYLKKYEHELNGAITREVKRTDYKVLAGKRLNVPAGKCSLRISGLSHQALSLTGPSLDEWRRLGGDALRQALSLKSEHLVIDLSQVKGSISSQILQAIAEGLALGAYEFNQYRKATDKTKASLQVIIFGLNLSPAESRKVLDSARAISEATCFARDLVNLGPSDLVPADLVTHAKKIARASKGRVKVKIYDRRGLERLGAGGILGVGKGSDYPPYLIHLHYKGKTSAKKTKKKTIALVGKGVTFDSGGYSIKPAKSMEDMKCDMSGAAAVLGTMSYLTSLSGKEVLEHDVHVIVPTVENMLNGKSVKPGDVLKALNGKTMEVLNTDAEGRLILADALAYSERLKPDVVIDLATLTGACIVALGSDITGLFSTDEKLAHTLKDLGAKSGELFWELPIASDQYRGNISSLIADIKNTGDGGPGAIIGALFLKEFVPPDVDWAHLDIAGPAFVTKESDYIKKGGTGFGVRTLIAYLHSL
ncbi:leucyl aminopeptidase [bacterium]|nr:leucyl aminopeptidase [bacterium]